MLFRQGNNLYQVIIAKFIHEQE